MELESLVLEVGVSGFPARRAILVPRPHLVSEEVTEFY